MTTYATGRVGRQSRVVPATVEDLCEHIDRLHLLSVYSVGEAAEILNISPSDVTDWLCRSGVMYGHTYRNGKITRVKLSGNFIMPRVRTRRANTVECALLAEPTSPEYRARKARRGGAASTVTPSEESATR